MAREIGRRALALEYLHADGERTPYRHDFTGDAELIGNDDGSLTLRSRSGRKLWRRYPTLEGGRPSLTPFLDNPPMKRSHARGRSAARKVSRRRSSSRATARGRGAPRHSKRRPPHGYSSWAAWMAHIRPGHKATARRGSSSAGGKVMAHKARRSSRRSAPRHQRRSGSSSRRRRTRDNPPNLGRMVRQAPQFAKHVVMMALAATAGKIVARKVRGSVFNRQPGTMVGSIIEVAVGVGGGLGLSSVNPILGEGFAIGGIQAPLETYVQQKQVKGISDSLADDGYVVGGNSGVGLISAYPDDYSNTVGDVGNYVGGPAGGSDIVAGYLNALDNAA